MTSAQVDKMSVTTTDNNSTKDPKSEDHTT